MKRRVLVLVAVIVFFLSLSAQAQEITPSSKLNSPSSNRFSIGVNDLPWDATKISLRWWKNESKGCELSLGYFRTELTDDELVSEGSSSSRDVMNLSVTQIRYNWLRRKKSSVLNELYVTRGIGLETDFSFRNEDIYSQYDTTVTKEERKLLSSSFYITVPIGFEHFFLRKYPNFSYSLEADFYCGFGYGYQKHIYNGITIITTRSDRESIRVGVSPRFYFRFYLK